jgi:HAD superfamily hydrolase (TIGR01459 family)
MVNITTPTETFIDDLVSRYDYFMLDIWGVVYDGTALYPGVQETLAKLLAHKKEILFLSNAPLPATTVMERLSYLGIEVREPQILTSGDLVRQRFKYNDDPIFTQFHDPFYHFGANQSDGILSGLSVNNVDILEKARYILFSRYLDEGDNLDQFLDFFQQALALELPIICPNPDKEIVNGKKLRYCAGYFAEQYENMGGIVYYYGKPYPAVYQEALKRFGIVNNAGKIPNILMVGDTLETDIAGANRIQIDSALVLTGNTGTLLKNNGIQNEMRLPFLNQVFTKNSLAPTWVIPGFGS